MTATVTAAMPAEINLDVWRGDTWSQQFRFLIADVPIDLTNITLASSARSTTDIVTDLVVTVVGAPTNGTLALSLPAGLKADLYDYDLEANDQGAVTTWVRGRLRLYRDVTNEQP